MAATVSFYRTTKQEITNNVPRSVEEKVEQRHFFLPPPRVRTAVQCQLAVWRQLLGNVRMRMRKLSASNHKKHGDVMDDDKVYNILHFKQNDCP